jgi:hypothetical protein
MIPVVAVTWRLLVAIGFIAIQKVDGYLHQRFVSHKKTLYTTNSDKYDNLIPNQTLELSGSISLITLAFKY